MYSVEHLLWQSKVMCTGSCFLGIALLFIIVPFPDRFVIAQEGISEFEICLFEPVAVPVSPGRPISGFQEPYEVLPFLVSEYSHDRVVCDASSAIRKEMAREAILALPQTGDVVRCLKKLLEPTRAAAFRDAATVLAQLGPSAYDAVPELVFGLQAQSAVVRHESALALGAIATGDASVEQALRQRLCDDNPSVRLAAAYSLWKVVPNNPDSLAVVIEMLGDNVQRATALRYLAEIGPPARPSISIIESIDVERRPDLCIEVAAALLCIDQESGFGYSLAEAIVNDRDAPGKDRVRAADLILRRTPTSELAKDVIYQELQKKNLYAVVVSAKTGLFRPAATRLLIQELQLCGSADDLRTRRKRQIAAGLLGCVGTPSRESIDSLQIAIADEDLCIRIAARKSFEMIEGRLGR